MLIVARMNYATGKEHTSLRGRKRLYNLVTCLGNSCPWTATVKSTEMLVYLESEVHELQEEIISMHSVRDGSDASSGRKHPSYSDRKKAMIAELGDVLFDVLMLEMMMRR